MTHAALQQFYVTHCTKADGATGTAGFRVRAVSTADPTAFHPVARLFDALFPLADSSAADAVADTLARWCELSEYAPDDARREAVQGYYVRTVLAAVVPPAVLADVLADDRLFLAPPVRDALTGDAR